MAIKSKTVLLALAIILVVLAVVFALRESDPPPAALTETPADGIATDTPGSPLPVLEVSPFESQLQVGEAGAVELLFTGFDAVQGAEVTLQYDTALLQVLSDTAETVAVQPGECPNPDFVIRQEAEPASGTVEYAAVSTSGVCAGGVLARIGFVCLSPGMAELELTKSIISDQSGSAIPHESFAGFIFCTAPLAENQNSGENIAASPATVTPILQATQTSPLTAAPTPTPAKIQSPTEVVAAGPDQAVATTANSHAYTLYIPMLGSEGATLSVSPSVLNLTGNGEFEIVASGFIDLYGGDIALSFDPAVIRITALTPGACPMPDLVVERRFDNTAGTVDYAVTQLNPSAPCRQGTLLTISFACLGKSAVAIQIPTSLLANPGGLPIAHDALSGTVTCR